MHAHMPFNVSLFGGRGGAGSWAGKEGGRAFRLQHREREISGNRTKTEIIIE